MREIKFRAFNKVERKMCRVVSIDFTGFIIVRFPEFEHESDDYNDQMLIEEFEPLMQFTGLYDKKCKEIYEGDIVRFHYKTGVYKIGTVVWNDLFGSWDIDCPDFVSYKSLGQYKSVSEVIGNIFEHKHLLEGTK